MDHEKRLLYSLASRLMDFPGEDLPNRESLLKAADSMPEGSRQVVLDFLEYVGKTSFIALQEEYTRTFDLNPSLCLNLTFHKWGDDKKRSSALVEFKKMYRDAGFDVHCAELPDYLPLVLEFLSVCRESACLPIYDQYGEQVTLIASRLREMQSPYAGLAEILGAAWRR
jgi:nitrate reductase delta subunit